MNQPLNLIQIETRGKEVKEIIAEIICQLTEAGFQIDDLQNIGLWEAFSCIREKDNLPSTIFRIKNRLDFFLVGADETLWAKIQQEIGSQPPETIVLNVKGKSITEQISEIEKALRNNRIFAPGGIKTLPFEPVVQDTDEGAKLYGLDIGHKLKIFLLGVSEDQVADLYCTLYS